MILRYSQLHLYVFLSCCTIAMSAQSAQILQNNPFEQPELVQVQKKADLSKNKVIRETWLPQLRATMRAGMNSMANINGRIIRIGENIEGFKLVEVSERDAFFTKNGMKYHVSMDQETDNATQ